MRRSLFLVMLLASVAQFMAASTEVPLVTNIYGREGVTDLGGKWRYIIDQQEIGFYDYRMNETKWGFFRDAHQGKPSDLVEYNFDTSPLMNIPGDWNTQDPQLFWYEGTVWFRRNFEHKPNPHHRTLLYFGAVNYEAVVYVNGQKQGTHIGGFTPFNFDITDALVDGKNNVVVKVDNKRHRDAIPTNIFDWWNYGGITRDVLLVEVPDIYVEDYALQLDPNNWQHIEGWVQLNDKTSDQEIKISIPELRVNKTFKTDSIGRAYIDIKAKPQLWCPETPKLYDMNIGVGHSNISDEIGFRCVETRGKQILLNGKPVFLSGVSIHEESPYKPGRAHTAEEAHTLLSWAKEMNCNFVRLAHYPHNEHAVREAEKMGIMVWSEIPCYWTIDWTNPETYKNAERQLHDMMKRDRNRACVVIWSIANETPHSEPRDKFLSSLAKYAHSQDSTRLVSMAMEVTSAKNFVNRLNDNMNEYVDVVAFNEYVGWYRDLNDASKMVWEIPYDKPVIVSEFGGGAVAGWHDSADVRFCEEFQENLYIENLKMLDKIDGLAGLSPWILKDFLSSRRPLNDVQDWFNRKGLVSDTGQKKLAFYVMQRYYANRNAKDDF